MKALKTPLIGLISGLILMVSSSTVHAQFIPASTPDAQISNGQPILPPMNVANDVVTFKNGELKAMVWDGDVPTLAFDYKDGAVTGMFALGQGGPAGVGLITDPDVVIDPNGSGRMLVVYKGQDDQIYLELFEYNDIGGAQVSPPKLVNPTTGFCNSPNVDVSATGDVVITWEENGDIFARRFNFVSGLYPHTLKVNGDPLSPSGLCSSPDVAIARIPGSLVPSYMVDFVFIKEYNGKKSVWLQRVTLDEITSGGKGVKNYGYGFTKQLFSADPGQTLGAPRIAAPADNPALSPYDFTVVVRVNDGSSDHLWAITHHLATAGFDQLNYTELNANPNDITMCGNGDPVVSYVGNAIITAWTYADGACALISGTKEVIVRQLAWDGTPLYPDYSIVNFDLMGDQYRIAVSGNHSAIGQTFYTFYDENAQSIAYKSSEYSNIDLKWTGNETPDAETSLDVYPVPVMDEMTLSINIAKGETPEMLEVYNMAGQVVYRFDASNLHEGNNTLTWNAKNENVGAGVYMIRLVTDKSTKSITVNKAK